jgi:hypothetical protein
MTAINKQYSYPRVTVIWINVHPTGKNPINMTCTFLMSVHLCLVYASYEQSPYVATFHESSTELDRITAPEKKGSRHNPQHVGWSIRGSVHSFSPESTNEAVEKAKHWQLGLPGPYHRHAIGTFNTYSRGPIHRSLTDTGGGYNLGGAGFPHTTPQSSQPAVFPFYLMAPLDL